jgi:hypothetical protein
MRQFQITIPYQQRQSFFSRGYANITLCAETQEEALQQLEKINLENLYYEGEINQAKMHYDWHEHDFELDDSEPPEFFLNKDLEITEITESQTTLT